MAERLPLVLLVLLGLGCGKPPTPVPAPNATPDLHATCCSQCRHAAATDPSAEDLDLVPCADYGGRIVNQVPVLEPRCREWFAQRGLLVQDCR